MNTTMTQFSKRSHEYDCRTVLHRDDGYRIAHVRGDYRAQLTDVLTEHYTNTAGGAGFNYAVFAPDGTIVGGALVGPAPSAAAARDIVAAPWAVWCLKRSYLRDGNPVAESQLIRASIRDVAEQQHATIVLSSYADPAAIDARTGRPLLGYCYLAAGFLFCGWTKRQRWAVIDTEGRVRSPRQGPITLTTRNIATLRPGWRMFTLPHARVWVTVVTPKHYRDTDGTMHVATRQWQHRQRRAAWAALNPTRTLAAKQWIAETVWHKHQAHGTVPFVEVDADGMPKPVATRTQRWQQGERELVAHERRQPAWWHGADLAPTASPVWVPEWVQGTLLDEATIAGEQTAGRTYAPRQLALADHSAGIGAPA